MKFNLKHRYLLTSQGNIRIRFIAIIAVLIISLLTLIIISGGDNNESPKGVMGDSNIESASSIDEPTTIIENMVEAVRDIVYDPEESGNGLSPFMTRIGTRPYFNKPYHWFKTIEVKSGDVLGTLMEETGLKGEDYMAASRALNEEIDATDIRPGHLIIADIERLGVTDTVKKVTYKYDSLTSVVIQPDEDGEWIAETKTRPLIIKTHAAKTTIQNSIYGSLGAAGVPDGIINRMMKAYSYKVDFQRDIWGEEEVEVLYETRETDDGEYVRSNRFLYANLKLRNKDMPIYLFEKDKGFPTFFEPDGQSVKRALMKTPIDGARLSSGFGMRTHPVLGYKKAHRGVDFAAPTGTPIYAAGDGIIQRANRFSSFGNYIKIRHNDTYSTAYAHLNGFAKGIKKGTRVKQGQTIGYVGTTGRSTGPHLHYEVHVNGKKVNPHSVDLPLGEQLKGTALANFKTIVKKRDQEFLTLINQ